MKLGYISVELVKAEQDILSKLIAGLGVTPLSQYPFHITMMYDKRDCAEPRCIINPDILFEATVTKFEVLGKAVVAILHSPGLHTEIKRLKEAGYQHSFEDTLLHLSLCWEPSKYDLLKIQSGLSDYLGKTLMFTGETLRDCE